jgi:SAM-dependent methyltransferase
MKCRHCATELRVRFADLGTSPPSNAYLKREKLDQPEAYIPLRTLVCHQCWLVQTEDFASAESMFDPEYAYFSGFSSSWLEHSARYAAMTVERFSLDEGSLVVEVAANDGYLLQYFKKAGVPCIGVEPTASTADAARAKGIDIVEDFFGIALAKQLVEERGEADLTAANNVLAHVPDINDFVGGFAALLKPSGVSTFEFPHLLRMVEKNQFDTIYHEHFSYLSLTAVKDVFARNGLSIFDVEELSTHGGSLRVFAQRSDTGARPKEARVHAVLQAETLAGIQEERFYAAFQARAEKVKDDFIDFLIGAKRQGKSVCAYGAAAKGNTLMNFAGVRGDLIQFVVDRNPAKQGKFMPGSRIPIVAEGRLRETKPDYIVVLPWNLIDEVKDQLQYATEWGGKFVTAVPDLKVQ